MPSKQELDSCYMQSAIAHSRLSKAIRAKVGATLVTSHGVMLSGYNGTPSGLDNVCEYVTSEGFVTKPEVIHAEVNAVLKAAKEGVSCYGSTVYVTLAPCVSCSAMLINAGISRLVYLEQYRKTEGLELLEKAGILVERYSDSI